VTLNLEQLSTCSLDEFLEMKLDALIINDSISKMLELMMDSWRDEIIEMMNSELFPLHYAMGERPISKITNDVYEWKLPTLISL
jgi:hypothetical protein